MSFCSLGQLIFENNIILNPASVNQVDLAFNIFIGQLPDHTHKRGNAATSGQQNQVVTMKQRIVMKLTGRGGTLELIANLNLIKQIAGDKTVGYASYGYFVISGLVWLR